MMSYEEAKRQLLLHTGSVDDTNQPLMIEDGFLPSLRPYRGLVEKNFHLVMEALLTVGEQICTSIVVERDIVQVVWRMCSTARIWGLSSHGMLQGGKLITDADVDRLELWVNAIEHTALDLLSGIPPHRSVYSYAEYVVAVGWWDNINFFIPLMQRAVSDMDTGSAITMILSALGKLGKLAKPVLPALNESLQRQYSWNRPEFETPVNQDRTTESVRADIRKAIDAILRGESEPNN